MARAKGIAKKSVNGINPTLAGMRGGKGIGKKLMAKGGVKKPAAKAGVKKPHRYTHHRKKMKTASSGRSFKIA